MWNSYFLFFNLLFWLIDYAFQSFSPFLHWCPKYVLQTSLLKSILTKSLIFFKVDCQMYWNCVFFKSKLCLVQNNCGHFTIKVWILQELWPVFFVPHSSTLSWCQLIYCATNIISALIVSVNTTLKLVDIIGDASFVHLPARFWSWTDF
jgi:hypothetical protein